MWLVPDPATVIPTHQEFSSLLAEKMNSCPEEHLLTKTS